MTDPIESLRNFKFTQFQRKQLARGKLQVMAGTEPDGTRHILKGEELMDKLNDADQLTKRKERESQE